MIVVDQVLEYAGLGRHGTIRTVLDIERHSNVAGKFYSGTCEDLPALHLAHRGFAIVGTSVCVDDPEQRMLHFPVIAGFNPGTVRARKGLVEQRVRRKIVCVVPISDERYVSVVGPPSDRALVVIPASLRQRGIRRQRGIVHVVRVGKGEIGGIVQAGRLPAAKRPKSARPTSFGTINCSARSRSAARNW